MPIPRRNTPPPDYILPPKVSESEPEPEPKLKKGERCNKKQDNCAAGLVCRKKYKLSIRHTCEQERSSKKKKGKIRIKSKKIIW